jgi:hypothetical protein
VDSLVAERRWQPHVDDGDVGAVLGDGVEERLAVADDRHDLAALRRQQQLQAAGQQDVVLGDHDPHGTS